MTGLGQRVDDRILAVRPPSRYPSGTGPGPFAGVWTVSSNTEVTTSSGQVWCWGDNQHGAVGNGFDVVEVGVRNYPAPQRVLSFE